MKEKETINMLLDIDHFYGQSEGRLTPWLLSFGLSGLPAVLYFYFLYGRVPLIYFIILWIPYTIRILMIFPGREGERLKNFYKIKNDSYDSTADQSNVKAYYDDGCIEYMNGQLCFNILTYNGTIMSDIEWSQRVTGFLEKFKDFDFDVRIHNIQETGTLEDRYKNVKVFNSGDYAQDYVDIINHNRKLIYSSTMLLRTTITVWSSKLYYKELKTAVYDAVNTPNAKAFKLCKVASLEENEELCSRDIGGYIDTDELRQRKYYTGQYYGSKVIASDDSDIKEQAKVEKRAKRDTTDFIPLV